MQAKWLRFITLAACGGLALASCSLAEAGSGPNMRVENQAPPSTLKVLAVETFLADIAQNVTGERAHVESLIPVGMDPHTFEPTPQDVIKISESQVLILNGAGFEEWAEKTLKNAGGERLVIEASAGLTMRKLEVDEPEHADEAGGHLHEGDPHFWFDPTLVICYVENIRDGLIAADPAGSETYSANAAAYIAQLNDLDRWIKAQVEQIPVERRLMVTDHHTFGYFADRYGFTVIGALIPGFSSGAAPSAQEMARLVDQIRSSGAPAIFLEYSSSPQLAQQIAAETGATVVTDLYTHSLTEPGGKAPTYIAMMRQNVTTIVDALK